MSKEKIIVIGNGMVGHKFLEFMADKNDYQLTVIGEEPRPAYDRVYLSSYFSGKTAEDLSLVPEGFYQTNNIQTVFSDKVVTINKADKNVVTESGASFEYDKLVLATGSYPFVPPVPGKDQEHCHVYRTIEDLDDIKASAANGKVGVVVGGGLLGLEAAKALKDLGLEAHVVEFAPRLMAVQVDDQGGELLKNKIEQMGVGVHTSKNTQNIAAGDNCRYKMEFADGTSLETDVIVFSAGIRPQDTLAREFDLAIGERGGIVIDNYCVTSDQNILAIGECALWENKIFGLVAPGYDMASVAAETITKGTKEFSGADMSTKLKLLGVDVASIGDAHSCTQGCKNYVWLDESAEVYKKIVVSEDGKYLLGAVMIGDTEDYGQLLQFMLNKMELPESPETLILPASDGTASAGLGVAALPDTAVICSCNNVTKADIVAAVQAGAMDMSALKGETKAATSCGGCAALAGQVLNAELANLGVEVKKDICEHFPYSRQELYHLIRTGNIRTFEELIEKHGKGHGCDICKPTAGSIFASCWNEHLMAENQAKLQDTNDYFLGNMQKNGTYSVVPRIPGGEITPEKLIVIGEVAKEFDLYTKITGGQRIDLFGAQLHQLPAIWEKLTDAGFESGHAYGKSTRTVKSCVGSTWCRYGVQDSVGMAIHLEERYKGVRAPHKVKFAVSGCTRECAEAQCKDFGVIATENGWNLYVCGNGGMKPRHADLFAVDLDDETLIRYIDRLFMFYIKTGERLQRTAGWMENMEGGLEYLQNVIINDSLGICAELEEQMQYLVDTFKCEWKEAISDPEKLKRFRHFVNSDASDENVVFVRERDQIRPATEDEKTDVIETIAV